MSAFQVLLPQQLPSNVLPFIWAVGANLPVWTPPAKAAPGLDQPEVDEPDLDQPRVYLYRKYSEAILRRYVRMAMEAGKVPSLIGQEMFRGNVTNYQIGHFDDVVIFLHDVDRCLSRLDPDQQDLIERIAVQQYTIAETASLLHVPARSVVRRYGVALDRLTRIFLAFGMLEAQKYCQGV